MSDQGTGNGDGVPRRDYDDRDKLRNGQGRWKDRVSFSDGAGGESFAFRTGEVLTTGGDTALNRSRGRNGETVTKVAQVGEFELLAGIDDPVAESELLRMEGHRAQPNHVFFAHCGGCCPRPTRPPAAAGRRAPTPSTPLPCTPRRGSTQPPSTPHRVCVCVVVRQPPCTQPPVYASPVYATPSSAYRTTGLRRSSVRPAPNDTPVDAVASLIITGPVDNAPRVIVLDTGLAMTGFRPSFGRAAVQPAGDGDVDEPDEDSPPDNYLDPAAGHGTFIAGLVAQVAPGCNVTVHRVLSTFGDGDEVVIATRIRQIADTLAEEERARTVLNLSFGGYAFKDPQPLAAAVAQVQALGVVVVASAGNDGTCRPALPAALPGVVSVGAIGPHGPAGFSNYGPWVRACAPGVDLLSSYFIGFEGEMPPPADGIDPDNFDGWALWSGTSFSAPVVAGALARTMIAHPTCTAKEAVERVVDAPSLMRIPNLGTVVNVI